MEALLILAVFCVGFPVFFLGIIFFLSRIGGWASLASHYGYDGPKSGMGKSALRKFRSLSLVRLKFLPCNYGNIINMYVDDQALYLSTMKVFAIGHSPLRIPFQDITLSHKKVFFVNVARLHVSKISELEIRMAAKDIHWIEASYGKLQHRL